MPYTNCSACGAKALVGATRCPRCQVPFVSYEFGGERVATVNCPNCGVQRPVAIGVCPNCLMSTAPSGRRIARGLVLTGVGIAVILAVGYLISRFTEQAKSALVLPESVQDTSQIAESAPRRDATARAAADTSVRVTPATVVPAVRTMAASAPATKPAVLGTTTTVDAAKSALPNPAAQRPAPPPSVAAPDTGRWEFATANTWVHVRAAPTRESAMLRMVDSAQRVRLGPPLGNGWRPIRVGVDRGWVDPRYFTIVRAPRL